MIVINNNKYNQNSYRRKTNNNSYLLHPNYEETTLSNIQRKHRVH